MPIYEFDCYECGEPFEKMVRYSEADLAPTCPKCNSRDTHKLISKVSFFGASFTDSSNSTSSNCGSGGGFS